MFPMAADPAAPVSGVGIKRSALSDDHEERPSGRSKGASSHQANKSTGKAKVVADAQDHGSDGDNERKRRRHLAIDINKVPHHDDDDLDNPLPATAGGIRCSPPQQHPHRALSLDSKKQELEIKKREIEIEDGMLELERERVQWAAENLREDMELKNMRLKNDRMRLENHWLLVEVKRKELELRVVRSKRI
ncbi:hypothetical protein CFC21_112185 [Triticum aestivum]|uniref:No apical meristem-associated C-terminal domain-containing protein n=3 Tax=Triticum TaxID=4564 RepID=A0A9R1LA42_WHEAT|nr:hypothetical protein CFC21_087097 [Triticum aestivum]MBC2899337.1 hypothetical protein [Triticum aestivum]VAI54736.1 unnamed protein product [Triticum turgidum subsp. durum]